MKPSDFQKTIQCQFECKLKQVIKGIVCNYNKELKRRRNKEVSFSELPDMLIDKMAVWDDYETDYTLFSVCGIDIRVLDDELAEALKKLPESKRNTLLMYYFLEMTESEIANLQKITQSGVFRNRHHALETMKKLLKEEK
ncbi:RNA polymerase sigma factor [[Clostridium] innocuum]|uniref:RNA polymerase sigma factor n=1 Tax=Clostridium innocuum TaxID=1522 RepID=UPI003258B0A3